MTRRRTTLALSAVLAATASCRADAMTGFCEGRGGTIVTVADDNGRPTKVCVLEDRTRMNAVAVFRNEHRTLK